MGGGGRERRSVVTEIETEKKDTICSFFGRARVGLDTGGAEMVAVGEGGFGFFVDRFWGFYSIRGTS